MDFFKDFSDLSNTPVYSKYDQESAKRNKSNKVETGSNKGVKDDFDDLLDNLMNKEDMKKSRRNNMEPYSSQNLGVTGVESFTKTTQKFNNISQNEINFNYGGLSKGGNKGSKKSILDDLMSEDNKSYKSGATGRRQNQVAQNQNIVKVSQTSFNNQNFQANPPGRAGMRPPLKKKGQSREPSLFNDQKSMSRLNDNLASIDDLQILSVTPKMPKRYTMQPDHTNQVHKQIRFELSPSKQKPTPKPLLIQKPLVEQKIIQKIIHVKQDNKQVTQRHQQELKLIKDSYQRQINSLKENYEKLLKDQQSNRKMMTKTYEQNYESQKKKWQKMMQNELQRVKSFYEWENKKKTESYDLQVKKLKELLQTVTRSQQKRSKDNKLGPSLQQTTLQLTTRLKQIQKEKYRLEQQKMLIQTKKRQFQIQEHEFQMYKKKQENKLNDQRKKLFQYETQIRKRQVESKKQFLVQKQSLAAELVNNQLILTQARQNVRHQNQKLNMERELFAQQKFQYEKINNKILTDLKDRKKALQVEREQLNNLQVQLYKKINTIQMMTVQKGLSNNKNISLNATMTKNLKRTQGINRSISYYEQNHKQNHRNRINSELDTKIADTKNRYAQIQQVARNNSIQKQSFNNQGTKIHLQKYIEKLSKDKLKMQKY